MSAADTKTAILDAAERLFADHGYGETSLRTVIATAGVNLAAVHYHFGSKEALFDAVLARRIQPINEQRLALLTQCETGARGKAPAVEAVLRAFISPILEVKLNRACGGEMFLRLAGRTLTEPNERVQQIMNNQFRAIAARFIPAFQRALPQLPAEELFWRIHFTIGALAHTMTDSHRIAFLSGGACDSQDIEGMQECLLTFLAAGLRAAAWRKQPGKRIKGGR